MFQKFPEILLVGATYNVNGVGMPLYCLMRMVSDMVELSSMLQQPKKMWSTFVRLFRPSKMKIRLGLQYVLQL